jgi:phosphoglucosamine mutase
VSSGDALFGTDGIRAPFGRYPLDEATVTALGRRLAEHLAETPTESGSGRTDGDRPATGPITVVLGGDTRASTPTLCEWIARGLHAAGSARAVETRYAGVIPTAGVASLVRDLGAAAGVVVSASHNPYPDNGIKLLDGDGFKWSREEEAALERRLHDQNGLQDRRAGAPAPAGDAPAALDAAEPGLVERYLAHLASSLPGERPLSGLRIALDTGNGAASPYAGALFERLGAEARVLHDAPDGTNVNRACGSTDPRDLLEAVRTGGFHLGAAFDGDADRVILVDADGETRDGDAILYLWASALDDAGALSPRAIVATSMSNLGLERALDARGIGMVRCGVGDREVVETMRRESVLLGGEQSGHIVHLGLTTTGDGLLTALQVAGMAARELREHDGERPLSELLAGFRRFPQVLRNVRVAAKLDLMALPAVARTVRRAEERLGDHGRLVLRYSGTEPLARVMLEGSDQLEIEELAGDIAGAIEHELGEGSSTADGAATAPAREAPV